jgi:hypothetical protein
MSSIPRTASSFIPGIPPIFFKRREKPHRAKPTSRVEPHIGVTRAAAPVAPARTATPAPATAKGGVDFDKLLAATRKAPVDLAIIEWEGDNGSNAAQAPSAIGTLESDPLGADARTRRIRDRYIGARFPGVARGVADLENPERVVKSARLYFEDGQVDSALELLAMAIEQDSRAAALWLAELEILFLARDAARFVECARAFRALHPASEQWAEVCRLGQALAPREGLFGDKSGPRVHEHYGPWPDLPNWIQANWDLTAEVLAADFRRLMKQRALEARANRDKPQLAA